MIRRFSVSIIGRVLSTLLQMAVFALYARNLGVAGFGAFSLALSITFGLLAFLDLGMGTRLLRGISSRADRSALATFTIIRYIALLLLPVIAGLVASLQHADPLLAVVGAAYAVGDVTGDVAVGALQGQRRSVLAMTSLLSRRIIALSLLLIFPTSLGVLVAALGAGAAGIVWFALVTSRHLAKPANLLSLVRENLGIILSGGASNFASLDVVVVSGASGAYGAGLYASAIRLFNPLNLAVSTMIQILVPELSASHDRNAKLAIFRRVRLIVVALGVLLMLASFLAPTILVALFGSAYSAAEPVAVAVFFCAGLSAVAQVHLSWFYSTRVPLAVPISMWASVATGLILIFVLSLQWQITGAAVGLVLMHLLTMLAVVTCWFIMGRSYTGDPEN